MLAEGTVIDGRYELLSLLGEGGMGAVYKAQERELDRIVAVKILHTVVAGDTESELRFEREGKLLSLLSNPHIITFYRFGLWQGHPYFCMEYLDGETLRDLLLRTERLEWEQVARIGLQICEGMQHAHAQGVIHRDLKPNNIIILSDPSGEVAKIVDFGLARASGLSESEGQKLTQTGELLGTIYYLSPEQCRGQQADPRSDIYSLGCILYEALVGDPPLVADNPVGLLHKHMHEAPARVSSVLPEHSVPAGLEAILFKAMSKEPSMRYQSMDELAADLNLLLEGRSLEISAAAVPDERESHRVGKISLVHYLGAAAAVCLISLLFSDPGVAVPVSLAVRVAPTNGMASFGIDLAELLSKRGRSQGAEMLLCAIEAPRTADDLDPLTVIEALAMHTSLSAHQGDKAGGRSTSARMLDRLAGWAGTARAITPRERQIVLQATEALSHAPPRGLHHIDNLIVLVKRYGDKDPRIQQGIAQVGIAISNNRGQLDAHPLSVKLAQLGRAMAKAGAQDGVDEVIRQALALTGTGEWHAARRASLLAELAELRADLGQHAAVIDLVERALVLCQGDSNESNIARVRLRRLQADAVLRFETLRPARNLMEDALEQSLKAGNSDWVTVYDSLCRIALDRHRPQDAKVFFDLAQPFFARVGSNYKPELLRVNALVLEATGKPGEAEQCHKESINAATSDQFRSFGRKLYAEFLRREGRPAEALVMMRQALPGLSKQGDTASSEYGHTLLGLGRIASDLGEFKQAEKYFLESLGVFSSHRAPYWSAIALESLAGNHLRLGQPQAAELRASQAIELCRENANLADLDRARLTLAEILLVQGKYKETVAALLEMTADHRFEGNGDPFLRALGRLTLARAVIGTNDLDLAKRYLAQAEETVRSHRLELLAPEIGMARAELLFKQGKLDDAEDMLRRLFKRHAFRTDRKLVSARGRKLLADILARTGQEKGAETEYARALHEFVAGGGQLYPETQELRKQLDDRHKGLHHPVPQPVQ